jgi:hypothetical protein
MTSILTNPFVVGSLAGFSSFVILSLSVQSMVKYLKWNGGLRRAWEREGPIGIFRIFGRIEQFLFFLIALVGKEAFGVIAAAWLVLKGVQQWVRWDSSRMPRRSSTPQGGGTDTITAAQANDAAIEQERLYEEYTEAHRHGLTLEEYRAQLDRNRFMIFVAGTGMSIGVGGVSGAVFVYAKENAQWLVQALNCFS